MSLELPALVYKDGGDQQRQGGTYSYLLVSTEAELQAALKAGWFEGLLEAIAGGTKDEEPIKPVDSVAVEEDRADNAVVTREELEQKATELGVRFHPQIGDANLLKKIEEAIALL